MRVFLLAFGFVMSAGAAVAADPVLGTWLSPPDGKGQTGHVVMRTCGDALCGKLERAYAPDGTQIVTKNVGKYLLTEVKPVGGGLYEGFAFVPLLGKTVGADIKLSGSQLSVKGCAGPVCKTQIWQRVN